MALLLGVAAGANAAPTASKPDADPYQGGPNSGAPYIEQVGSECVMVNVYLEQRDGVAQQVILREPVECSRGSQGQELAVAHLSN
ncbi:hypothetical protein [Xanthomonas graminis]|uniref:Uncharacterized protein n=1 Tax=Xanthomonas graminis pv. poae TaxID=227946 RepID=A0A199P7L1_9XANT|nr:hypothetical protein [Xanthomonas translucens]OAX56991.1 hypothetical protein A6R73_11905 [Xanthomonas translucens pv. poae]